MKVGNMHFNLDVLKDVSKEEFIQCYRGKLDGIDINEAYEIIQNELNKDKPKQETKQNKKPRNK
jgi:hypothetical protein